MEGEPPANLQEVDPRARQFPASWRDAAIRVSFDYVAGGVRCSGCKEMMMGRRGLSLLQSDHILPWSRGGLTIWINLQLLCRPCNIRKGARMGVLDAPCSDP